MKAKLIWLDLMKFTFFDLYNDMSGKTLLKCTWLPILKISKFKYWRKDYSHENDEPFKMLIKV